MIPQKSDEYLFYVQANIDGTVGTIELNEHIINLVALPDPTNVYFSADNLGQPLKIKLEAGSVNTIKLTGFDADFKLLKWKTASTASSNIPENVLVANHLSDI
ncbi:MAG: hypothetical protein IPN46_13945 [Saprospiraceae bacterium]|nr:hypothetical protein [Saprospiraceae bacterium]